MAHTILAIDIGNTNITLGRFHGRSLVRTGKVATAAPAQYYRRLAPFARGAECAIISSVVPLAQRQLMPVLKRCGIRRTCIMVLGIDAPVPIQNLYKAPRQVGQDRLVNAFASKGIYGAPSVVVDFGTAATFDIVSRRGAYLGGLILPGIELSFRGLYERTALLPRVTLKPARHIIGRNTVESMRGGILFGFGALCDGLVAKYKRILGKDTRVIATGGNARLIKRYTSSIDIVDENLTLKGLCSIAHTHILHSR